LRIGKREWCEERDRENQWRRDAEIQTFEEVGVGLFEVLKE
jgi:hypothetical protein